MATQEQLDHDRLRLAVARRVEQALGLEPEGITSYFECQPEEDEQPGQYPDDQGLEFSREYGDDEPYDTIARTIFDLPRGTTEEGGVKAVYGVLCDVRDKFGAAASLLFEDGLGRPRE